ncbi:hypothetical protein HY772_03640 [Candidatus Woesearchaeota archaeon]|nr:hypothetical protein [Candidatus Woesearchaeota archaeon]
MKESIKLTMYKTITEGSASIHVPVNEKISHKLDVFYNPVMKFNRDISILLLNSIESKNLTIADPLAGSGVRGIRFMCELDRGKIATIAFNDHSAKACALIKKNIELNHDSARSRPYTITNQDANMFLLQSKGFDYIDIDPFGSPNPFLNNAVIRLSRTGLLAVTATDTSSLCGTYARVCRRRYWAQPHHNHLMHELGLRILIRKVQLVASQFEKALEPVFSYSKEHYMRVFFAVRKSKSAVDKIIDQHGTYQDAGPLWTGRLWDNELVKRMMNRSKPLPYPFDRECLNRIAQEAKISTIGFYDIHMICKAHKMPAVPKFARIIDSVKQKGYLISPTHFSPTGLRTTMPREGFEELVRNCI